ncbi:ABC transporter ATP-binding protein [Fodinibius salsisoli]|uniref:ABC transporter ATP-binding protein n=1 Tax=Fodinibius salsisoli TaxID=2820877 RepID=A0ABT3PS77_9BACT|nr:ABC transporter ATP-binding protein [Fodinibius salsisoli]MCW9708718.1 ABC transporter ATP-binding protein [Fodinibius salsisoli]
MIELQKVSKYYGQKAAVVDLSFKIEEGEIFGLIGTSGCGKTTTLKMINRLVTPSSGHILINGEDINSQPSETLRRHIGYVIQNVGLFPHYTVQQNIATVPRLLQWDDQRISERTQQLLRMVGLEPETFARRAPDELSGGQQQRVGLARALAADPPIILMDEPFGALDPITKQQVRGEVKQLLKNIQKTIVLVTHDVGEAFDMCDRLCLLDQGKVQQVGTPRELLFNPQNDFVDSFFKSNRLQLEMMSITTGDILEILQSSADTPRSFSEGFEGNGPRAAANDSFFSVFQDAKPEAHSYVIYDKEDQPVASVTSEQLLSGFYRVRHKLKEKQG